MLRLAAVVTIAALASAAGSARQDYPHAFPRTGTRQIVDTPRVTVWEVNWIHGVPQPYHRHRYDMAGVYLRFGEITVTRPDGTATTGQAFDVPRPYFQPRGITHKEEAKGRPGDPERLAIMLDLKDVPEAETPLPGGTPDAFPRDGATNVLENDRVRMWDYTWTAGEAATMRRYAHDAVEVIVAAGTLLIRTPDGGETTRMVAPKEARFVPRGTVEAIEARTGTPRAIVVELK
ncbi:MAG: hypothetical protein R2712_17025 [Vicinamibacterales bacterium]